VDLVLPADKLLDLSTLNTHNTRCNTHCNRHIPLTSDLVTHGSVLLEIELTRWVSASYFLLLSAWCPLPPPLVSYCTNVRVGCLKLIQPLLPPCLSLSLSLHFCYSGALSLTSRQSLHLLFTR